MGRISLFYITLIPCNICVTQLQLHKCHHQFEVTTGGEMFIAVGFVLFVGLDIGNLKPFLSRRFQTTRKPI